MTERLSPVELAERVAAQGHECSVKQAVEWLKDWERRGIAEQRLGRWRLTKSGRAMFGGWATSPPLEEAA